MHDFDGYRLMVCEVGLSPTFVAFAAVAFAAFVGALVAVIVVRLIYGR